MKVGTTKAPATARTPSGVRGTEPGPFPLLHKRRLASHTASPYRAKHDGRNFSRRWSKRSPSVYLHSCPKPSGARPSSLGVQTGPQEALFGRDEVHPGVLRCCESTHSATFLTTLSENYELPSGEPARRRIRNVVGGGHAPGHQIIGISLSNKWRRFNRPKEHLRRMLPCSRCIHCPNSLIARRSYPLRPRPGIAVSR